MTLEQINYIAQTIAAFAVVGSLIYLAIQTRQNTAVMRATAARDAQLSFVELNDQLADGGVLSDIVFRISADPASLTDFEKLMAHRFIRAFLQRLEAQYALYRHGILDREIWELRRHYTKSVLAAPMIDEIWQAEKRNSMLTAAFIAEIDGAPAGPAPVMAGIGPMSGKTATS